MSWLTALCCCLSVCATLRAAAAAQHGPQANASTRKMQEPDEFDRLRAMLARSGAEGLEARESAVEQLLAMPKPEAHRILQQQLLRTDDPDALRRTILAALQRHFLGSPANLFGGAAADVRRQVLLPRCAGPDVARGWRRISDATDHPLRAAVSRCSALRAGPRSGRSRVMRQSTPGKILVLRCLADMQQSRSRSHHGLLDAPGAGAQPASALSASPTTTKVQDEGPVRRLVRRYGGMDTSISPAGGTSDPRTRAISPTSCGGCASKRRAVRGRPRAHARHRLGRDLRAHRRRGPGGVGGVPRTAPKSCRTPARKARAPLQAFCKAVGALPQDSTRSSAVPCCSEVAASVTRSEAEIVNDSPGCCWPNSTCQRPRPRRRPCVRCAGSPPRTRGPRWSRSRRLC